MKLLRKFTNLSKKVKAVVAIAAATVAVAVPLAVKAEFYPGNRPTFDYNKMPVNGSTCTDADKTAYDRCGSLTGPVFNSFVNTPSYGDERAFFDGRRSDITSNANADQINDVTQGSKEVVLRTYVHNNANQNTNASGLGVAKDTKVRILLPTDTAQVLRARSYISADNAAQVEDTADMLGTQQFSVSYVPGSAKLLRGTSQYALSDNIVTTGALIGDQQMNGNLPGCFDYAALVEIHVKINVANYNLNLTKQVRKHVDGQKGNWSKEVSVKAGDKVDYLLNTANAGTAELNSVVTRDVLPPHVKLVPGSVSYVDASGTHAQNDVNLFGGGLNAGKYNASTNSLITFTVVAQDDFYSECSTKVRNVAYAKSSTTPEINDYADVIITRENCQPEQPKTPVYTCDLLTKQQIADRAYRYTVNYTALNGASLKFVTYNFGDGSDNFMTDKTTADHTYAKDGTFVTRATLTFSVNGQDKVVDSDKCAVPVTLTSTPPKTPETPQTPAKELPNTGAGDILGLFGATSLIGAILHRLYATRKA
jgi:uncharacterized repeat protein (TIGR01451 family)